MTKFSRGALCGLIAGIAKDIPAFTAQFINNKIFPVYWDYSGMLAFGKTPQSLGEYVYAIIVELIVSVAVGTATIFLLDRYPRQPIIKAGSSAVFFWLLVRAMVVAYQISPLAQPQLEASILNLTTTFGYGLLIGWLNKIFTLK